MKSYDKTKKNLWRTLPRKMDFYRDLMDNANDLIQCVDPHGKFIYVNKAWKKTLGYNDDDLDKITLFDIIHPDYDYFKESFKAVMSGQVLTGVEAIFVAKDGRRVNLQGSVNCRFENDRPLFTRAVLRDTSEQKKAENALNIAYTELEQIFNTAVDGMRVIDKDFRVRRTNDNMAKLSGIEKEEAEGKKCYEVFSGKDCQTPNCPLMRIMQGEDRVENETVKVRPDGKKTPCIVTATPFRGPDGQLIGIVENFKDITERKKAEEIQMQYQLLSQITTDIILFCNYDGQIIEVNDAAIKAYGYTKDELLSMKTRDIIAFQPEAVIQDRIDKAFKGAIVFESFHRRKDGSTFPIEVSSQGLVMDNKSVLMNIIRDITERKRAEEKINYLAYHDMLTTLPNRVRFFDHLVMELKHAKRNNQMLAVMFLDLDGFKFVNDNMGHAVGDQLLKEVADRLVEVVRKSDTVARIGGDEFTLLLPGLKEQKDAALVARKIIDALKVPWMKGGHEFSIMTSIGIALYPNDGQEPDGLMKHADIAMYKAKKKGNSYQFYKPNIKEH